ncbi:MAG: cytochrome-c peroxidase [Bdellovibrionales bacterium CG10_big_fil_rev_8_21_14_0_10_45_34]|nr:MAG: cytochrome-c peroxidase [Bdellovibrionales bacterium CG10_big_fil_rev_8_21_14_0_10_45_34]
MARLRYKSFETHQAEIETKANLIQKRTSFRILRLAAVVALGFFSTHLVVANLASANEPLPETPPIPKDNPQTPQKIELGKQLYFDPRLSSTGTVSCNSCHNVMATGDDSVRTSAGVNGHRGDRNSPTVWNSAFWSVQFWDGRAPTLEEQAKGPLVNPIEMGLPNHNEAVKRVKAIAGYRTSFKRVFGGRDPITVDNIAKAIASYERTLITPDSAFDRYLKGEKTAISKDALEGYELAQNVGCFACHSGPHFAGPQLPTGTGFYMRFPTFSENDYVKTYELDKDLGRMKETKKEADKHMYRVPSWRNIAITAPYFHNGSVSKLDEAVRVMAKTQLNRDLKSSEVTKIVKFLESLTGQIPQQTMPQLPLMVGESLVN